MKKSSNKQVIKHFYVIALLLWGLSSQAQFIRGYDFRNTTTNTDIQSSNGYAIANTHQGYLVGGSGDSGIAQPLLTKFTKNGNFSSGVTLEIPNASIKEIERLQGRVNFFEKEGYAVAGNVTISPSNTDIFFVRTDTLGYPSGFGRKRTYVSYGGTGKEYLHDMITYENSDNYNRVMMVGSTSFPGSSRKHGLIIKTDGHGNVIKTKTISQNGSLLISSIVKASDNHFFLAGLLDRKLYIAKMDKDLNLLWEKSYVAGENCNNEASVLFLAPKIQMGHQGNIVGMAGFQGRAYAKYGEGPEVGHYLFMFRLTGDGEGIWAKDFHEYNTNYMLFLKDFQQAYDNNILNYLVSFTAKGETSLMKLNFSGIHMWAHSYRFEDHRLNRSSGRVVSDGDKYVVTASQYTGYHPDPNKVLLAKVKNDGTVPLASSSSQCRVDELNIHSSNYVLLPRELHSSNGIVLSEYRRQPIAFDMIGIDALYGCYTNKGGYYRSGSNNGADEKSCTTCESKTYLYQNSPNPPADGQTIIQYELPEGSKHGQIVVTNFVGEPVASFKNLDTKGTLTLHTHTMKKGIYHYSLMVNDKIITTKKLLIEE